MNSAVLTAPGRPLQPPGSQVFQFSVNSCESFQTPDTGVLEWKANAFLCAVRQLVVKFSCTHGPSSSSGHPNLAVPASASRPAAPRCDGALFHPAVLLFVLIGRIHLSGNELNPNKTRLLLNLPQTSCK